MKNYEIVIPFNLPENLQKCPNNGEPSNREGIYIRNNLLCDFIYNFLSFCGVRKIYENIFFEFSSPVIN